MGVAVPASPELKAYIQTLIKRAERLRSERVDPKEDNMLCITNYGRKAALDMRLINPACLPGGTQNSPKWSSRCFEFGRRHALVD
jgi:hypothetical protein